MLGQTVTPVWGYSQLPTIPPTLGVPCTTVNPTSPLPPPSSVRLPMNPTHPLAHELYGISDHSTPVLFNCSAQRSKQSLTHPLILNHLLSHASFREPFTLHHIWPPCSDIESYPHEPREGQKPIGYIPEVSHHSLASVTRVDRLNCR